MSHEVESMFFAREVPWHGLGEDYRGKGLLTALEAVNATPELASKIEHWPFYAVNPEDADEYVMVPNKWEVIRKLDQRPLGEVANVHELFQTEDLARLVDEICGTGEAKFETGGSLRFGQVVWFCARLTEDMMVGNDPDELMRFYLFVQDWRQGGALSLKRSQIRPVCMNTLDAASRGFGEEFNIRHTTNADERIEAAQRAQDQRRAGFGIQAGCRLADYQSVHGKGFRGPHRQRVPGQDRRHEGDEGSCRAAHRRAGRRSSQLARSPEHQGDAVGRLQRRRRVGRFQVHGEVRERPEVGASLSVDHEPQGHRGEDQGQGAGRTDGIAVRATGWSVRRF